MGGAIKTHCKDGDTGRGIVWSHLCTPPLLNPSLSLPLLLWHRLCPVHLPSTPQSRAHSQYGANLYYSEKYSLEGLMLKLQYFCHLMQRADSLEKALMLGKTEGRRRRGPQRMRWLDGIINSMHMSLSQL